MLCHDDVKLKASLELERSDWHSFVTKLRSKRAADVIPSGLSGDSVVGDEGGSLRGRGGEGGEDTEL